MAKIIKLVRAYLTLRRAERLAARADKHDALARDFFCRGMSALCDFHMGMALELRHQSRIARWNVQL